MATEINVKGDTIRIDKAFVSGKDRVTVNGEVAFEGKLSPGTAQDIVAGSRSYTIESRVVSKLTSALAYHLHIYESNEQIHAGIYDQTGRPVANDSQAKAVGAIHVCGMVGMGVGLAGMLFLNLATGIVPGGAIGGAIGGGGGAAIGYGIGTLLFRDR